MSEPLRQDETKRESAGRGHTRTRKHPRRLARWLTVIIALLVLAVILGAIALHELSLANRTLSGVSAQVNHSSLQAARFHQTLLQSVAAMQHTLDAILARLNLLVRQIGRLTGR